MEYKIFCSRINVEGKIQMAVAVVAVVALTGFVVVVVPVVEVLVAAEVRGFVVIKTA